jgi:hypothetical protein
MFKKINLENKAQKLNKIISKFKEIKSTVMNLKKVSQYYLIMIDRIMIFFFFH